MSTDSAAQEESEPTGPAAGTDAAPDDVEPPEAGAAGEAAPADTPDLSQLDRAVLAVERRSWAGPGVKERVIRERLGLSPTRYYQVLNALLDDARALALDPVTVNRLRRQRAARRQRR